MTGAIRQPASRGQEGFTLLELVVTLGLLALIVAAIMAGLNTGRRVWQIRSQLDDIAATGAARSVLAARLADAMPLLQQSPSGLATFAFAGTAASLDFVAPLQRSSAGGGLFRQSLKLAPVTLPSGKVRRNLVLEEAVFSDSPSPHDGNPPPRQTVLVEDVAGLAIRYSGPVPASPAPAWSGSWQHRDALPQLIGITVVFAAGDARQWPELMVAPGAAAASR